MTSSEPTYVVVMNGSLSEASRNLSSFNVSLNDVIVTNGTPCVPDVSPRSLYLWWITASVISDSG